MQPSIYSATAPVPGESVPDAAGAPTAETVPSAGVKDPPFVIFFDGVCGLCNRFVDFVLIRDLHGKFVFAPLQGTTAAELLESRDIARLDSMVFKTPRGVFRRSAAAVRILWTLGGIWRLLGSLLWLIPLPLRDLGYSLIARWRYTWFGKHTTCRLPDPAEQTRFLP